MTDDQFYIWLAGFVDADGCFTAQVNRHNARTQNSNVTYHPFISIRLAAYDTALLETIRDRTGVGKVYFTVARHQGHVHSKPGVSWQTTKLADAAWLARRIQPYLLSKPQACERFLCLCERLMAARVGTKVSYQRMTQKEKDELLAMAQNINEKACNPSPSGIR